MIYIYIYVCIVWKSIDGRVGLPQPKKKLGVMVDVSVVTWGWKPTDQSTSPLI